MDDHDDHQTTGASVSIKALPIVLRGPDNWHEWIFLVKNASERGSIWVYVNPALITPTPLPPEPVRPVLPPVALRTPEAKADYLLERDEYILENKRYQAMKSKLNDLDNAIMHSIDHHFISLFYSLPEATVHAKLKALKDHIAPSDRGREYTITARYEALSRVQKRMKVSRWLLDFEKVYNEAHDLGLACVDKDRAIVDFLTAVKVWEESWANTQLALLIGASPGTEPTIHKLIQEFSRLHHITRGQKALSTTRTSHSNIAFAGASLNGRKDTPPCVCGGFHWYIDCYYLNEDKRPSNWTPSAQVKALIATRFQNKEFEKSVINKIQASKDHRRNSNHNSGNNNRGFNRGQRPPWKPRRPQQSNNFDNQSNESLSDRNNQSHEEESAADLLNFSNAAAYSATSIETLRQQWILDSGSDIHITNDINCLTDVIEKTGGQVIAGATRYRIQATGTASLQVDTPTGVRPMTLPDVAFIPHFMTNVVSLSLLMQKGVHWNTKDGWLTRNDRKLALISRIKGHWTLARGCAATSALSVDVRKDDDKESLESLFSALSVAGCPECYDNASFAIEDAQVDSNLSVLWHARLGHPGLEALSHLKGATIDIPRFVIDRTICESCRLAKATEIISRTAYREIREEHPFHRVSCDLLQLERGYNGDQYVVHFQCYQTGFSVLFCEPKKGSFMRIIKLFLFHVKTQYRQDVRIIRIDGESSMSTEVVEYLRNKGIAIEPSVPYTPAQNGHAERTGRTLLTKARALRLDSRLPHDLWPEIVKTAAYLMNRTPTRRLGWKTPFEALFGSKPSLKHLHIIGCKAFVLRHNIPRRMKLDARANIGYLVGYDSTNIWRIWHPANGYTIIRARSVWFDEGQKFDSSAPDDIAPLASIEGLTETLDQGLFSHLASSDLIADETDEVLPVSDPDGNQDTIEVARPVGQNTQLGNLSELTSLSPTSTPQTATTPQSMNTPTSALDTRPTTVSPGPLESPSSGRVTDNESTTIQEGNTAPRASQISTNPHPSLILPEGSKRKKRRLAQFVAQEDSEEPLAQCYMTFSAALTDSNRVNYRQSQQASADPAKLRLHRDTLPPEPKGWRDLATHRFGPYWIEAAHTEFNQLIKRGTFKEIDRQSHHRPLPLLWVFKYKFDTEGSLIKFKARIVVRGDLQASYNDNYAATLAIRVFRALMALSAAFDLEMIQLDAVNAFLNSDIDEDISIQWPPGFQGNNKVLKLLKALYGLKQAPQLWHNHLVTLLSQLGLRRVPGVNCVLISNWLIVFFYVDDIILIFSQEDKPKAQEFLTQLKAHLELREMDQANWFLGIRIIRDRPRRLLWLCQDSYIDKVAARFKVDNKTQVLAFTPLPTEFPGPYDGEATAAERHGYQSRVGSINFAAVITRPDIAKACSLLAQHLQNPGPQHIRLADRVIAYLTRTKYLAIEYSGHLDQSEQSIQPEALISLSPFQCYSDAAFADNLDRKSSDGYLFILYGGPIDWKASKQTTVTTSSTEAELLALSRTAKEIVAWQRLFREISFSIDGSLLIQSDNRQAIRLLKQQEPLLTTKLRHVDIHQHWLRQEVQLGNIDVEWTSTTTMKADGLTKSLPRQQHERFMRQLNLVDIQIEVATQLRSGRVC